MARTIAHKLIWPLAVLVIAAQANFVAEKRQISGTCEPGATICGTSGLTRYCANPGYKCCDTRWSAPLTATCCPGGSYAPAGSYCCSDGRYCQNGFTCTGCTPAKGSAGFSGTGLLTATIPLPATTAPPVIVTSHPVAVVYTYYYTITYFYYQWYYTYVSSLARSTATSSAVTTSTTFTVYASNTADAQSSFDHLSATAALPTPASATVLPPLPSQTLSFAPPASTTTRGVSNLPTNASTTTSTTTPRFTGAAGRLWDDGNSYKPLFGWLAMLVVGVIGFYANLLL